MALLFCDSFDHYDDDYENFKYEVTNSALIAPSSGRRGGGALQTAYLRTLQKSVDNKQTLIVGAAVSSLTLSYSTATHYDIFALFDGATRQIQVRLGADVAENTAYVQVLRDGTTLGTSTERVILGGNVWQYIELKVYIHATAGTVELRVNGTPVINLTGQNTQATANAYATGVRLGFFSNTTTYIDDFYICDDSGSVNNDFLGDIKVVAFYPEADGAHTDFTPSTGTDHYACVDEPLSNISDYNDGTAVNQIDTYGITVSSDLGTILGAQVVSLVQNPDVGTRKVKNLVRSGSTDYPGSSERTLSATWGIHCEVWETDPGDSAAWTKSKLDAAEFGLKVTE